MTESPRRHGASHHESAGSNHQRGDSVQLDRDLFSEPAYGSTLLEEMAATDLKDQEKLAVVLQAAALLSHSALARQVFGEPGAPWRGAALDKNLWLRVGPGRPGRFAAPTQRLLSDLLQLLFHSHSHGQIAGRGVARRSARQLLALWSQELVPLAADRAIGQIFAAAPFLWDAAWGLARQTLAAGLERPGDGRLYLLVAGPGGARRRFLRAAPTLESARALLGSGEARDLFEGASETSDPASLLAAGQPWRAIAAWRRSPPQAEPEKLQFAQLLLDLGQGTSAGELLEGLSSPKARLLRAQALLNAGERHRAEKALAIDAALFPAMALEKAELEIRLLAGQGELEAIRRRIAPLLTSASARPEGDPLRLETFLIAAGAAWDCGDRQAMIGYLDAAGREPSGESRQAGRFHQLQALAAQEVGDGLRAVAAMRAALAGRRGLSRHRAGRLWNDMAVSRVLAGDLGGAERAARHAWRLLECSEGSGPLALALTNLAEVRLRRGRFDGVEATLERSIAQNRLAANWRGVLLDLETITRLELGLGRPAAALARCTEALGHAEASAARHEVFELFAARAHGWLGRPEEAERALDAGGRGALGELEAEERPAVLALAGRSAEALQEAHGTPWQGLWQALLAATHPPREAWLCLRLLEPYRAARLVFDCERLMPGVAPREELRRAQATLRAVGAEAMAMLMASGSEALAAALERYAAHESVDLAVARELLEDAGYGAATLTFRDAAGALVPLLGEREPEGPGEEQAGAKISTLSLPCAGGELLLRASQAEKELVAIFALLRRDLEKELEGLQGAARHGGDRGAADEMPFAVDGIIGRDPLLLAAVGRLDAFAAAEVSVLILGESGSGKELFARRLHRRSRRAKGPFLAVNCAALSESLILSDLFGHVRGGFTGADRDRAGIFESARGGTVFLDEIGDLPLSCQGHLLRVLQESEIRRVGESFARKVDVRVVTATHRDLDEEVAAGRFRLDLFYRLRAAQVVLPALRRRLADLPVLASHFLARLPATKTALRLSKEAQQALTRYSWPGNIRELKNVIEVAAALACGEEITSTDLELPGDTGEALPESAGETGDYHQQIEDFRRRLVKEALAACKGHRSDAARRLGLTRQALSYLIRQLGLH